MACSIYSLTWAGAPIDEKHQLIISPRNGRSYIIKPASDETGFFLLLAGLKDKERSNFIEYVSGTPFDTSAFYLQSKPQGYWFAKLLFNFAHSLRTVFSPKMFVALAIKLGKMSLFRISSIEDAIQIVRMIEKENGFDACFARSVLLFALAAEIGVPASLYLGVLAPCTKMHAWTVIDESILYEPTPEHWMYFPVLRFSLFQE